MRFTSVRYLLPVVAIAAFGAVVACSGSDDSSKLTVTDATNPAAVVITMYAGDNGAPSGTAVGTLIAPRLVLTAGHNIAGKSGWKIEAPNAKSQKAAGLRGMTYDWKNFGSDKSHPDNTDIAVIELDQPITIDSYPTIATSPIPDGAQVTRIRREVDGISLSNTKLKAVTGATFSAAPIGFPTSYFMATEASETIDSGGALMDMSTNTIYGVVSGQGLTTKALYIARVDGKIGAGWVPQYVLCHTKTVSDGGKGGGGGSSVDGGGGGDTTPQPPPSSCWGTACGGDGSGGSTTGGKGGGGKGGSTGGDTTGGKGGGGSTAGDTTGGKGGGGSTAGGGTCEGGGKGGGGGGSGTSCGTTGGKGGGGSTSGSTTGGSTTGTSTGGSTSGSTTGGSTTGTSTGGSTSGSTTGGSTSGTTAGTTGGSSTSGTGGSSTSGTGGSSTSGTGGSSTSGTGGSSTSGTGGSSTSGTGGDGGSTGGGGTCDGPECGGCDESNPNCEDPRINYGDCACGPTPTTGPIY